MLYFPLGQAAQSPLSATEHSGGLRRRAHQAPALDSSAQSVQVIDASSGLFCVAAGHCRREIAEAVYRQLQTLDFMAPFLRSHPRAFELAQRIAEFTAGDLNRIFFVNSGSEAVDTAMKIALMSRSPTCSAPSSRAWAVRSTWPAC